MSQAQSWTDVRDRARALSAASYIDQSPEELAALFALVQQIESAVQLFLGKGVVTLSDEVEHLAKVCPNREWS
jgi:hypothetical protein